ncbi:ankyrin-1-like [Artemia franciscana]|uniref:Uncharacterized protein n=1 Tax=Artemia franciscana TaxID=6661 RepID=A0AA88HBI1_ARTSF|nr:hypothetical protein QYM36_018909 [Artemia franciscana]
MSDPATKAGNPKQRKTSDLNFENVSRSLPIKTECSFAELPDKSDKCNSKIKLSRKSEPSRKRNFEEMSDPAAKAENPKQRKTSDLNFENVSRSLPIKTECSFTELTDKSDKCISKIKLPRKSEPSRKRDFEVMKNPGSKAVNKKKGKICNLSFQSSSAFAPVKAKCISVRLLGTCSCEIESSKKSCGRAPLHQAAAEGKLDMCQLLLSKGAGIDTLDNKGYTPLHWAEKKGQICVAKYLLKKGANLHLKSKKLEDCGQTPLHFAAAQGNLGMCQLLVSKGADMQALDNKRLTPLQLAVKEEKIFETRKKAEEKQEIVKLLLSKRASVGAVDKDWLEPLHYAAKWSNLDIFQLLYSKKFRYLKSCFTFTSLHWAAKKGQISVAIYLLEKGANINLKTCDERDSGRTPLHFAASKGKFDMCRLLVSKGALIDALDVDGRTPLHLAVRENCKRIKAGDKPQTVKLLLFETRKKGEEKQEIVKLFLSRGASTAILDKYGLTPLHYAAKRSNLDIFQLLYSKNFRYLKSCFTFTSLHWAAKEGQIPLATYLIEKGANINLKTCDERDSGGTPLHFAASKGKFDMCRLLVSKGALIDALDVDGRTPLHLAVRENCKRIKAGDKPQTVKLLLFETRKKGEEKQEIVKLFLSRGASTAILDKYGLTPLHYAAKRSNLDIFQLLYSKNFRCCFTFTSLHWATEEGQIPLATYLLEKGANINLKTCNRKHRGQTPLHFAAGQGRLEMCRLLVSKGALIDALDVKKRTPLHCAVKKNDSFVTSFRGTVFPKAGDKMEIVKLLLSRGATVDTLDEDMLTPLAIALSDRNFAVAEYLLEKKATYHPNKKDKYRVLLEDQIKKCNTDEETTMKLYSRVCNLALNEYDSLKSICRHVIVNNMYHVKLSDCVERFNLPFCLKKFLTFEEELQLCFKRSPLK